MQNEVVINAELERLKEIEKKQKERYKKQNLYTNSIYDRISFTIPTGKKKEIEELAKQNGKTLNKFISEVMLLTLVNNDVNNALNNNTYEEGNVFIIPDELKAKIKLYSDDVIGYINSAIFEKLELDEQIAMDLESEQEEEPTEQPQIEPITAQAEEVSQEQMEEPKKSYKEPTIEELQEWQAQLMAKKAEQDKRAEEQKKRKEEKERQEQEERKNEILSRIERIRNGEPIEEDAEKEKARKESIAKSALPY